MKEECECCSKCENFKEKGESAFDKFFNETGGGVLTNFQYDMMKMTWKSAIDAVSVEIRDLIPVNSYDGFINFWAELQLKLNNLKENNYGGKSRKEKQKDRKNYEKSKPSTI